MNRRSAPSEPARLPALPSIASAEAWPKADALFHRDPRWRGSDDAYTVPIGPGRTLWLFGDTFVGESRATAAFIRNTAAIQEGDDPVTAGISFAWRDGPSDAFPPSSPDHWLWPLHGARVEAGLVLFFMLVRAARPGARGGLDDWRAQGTLSFFRVDGWDARFVPDPDGPLERWTIRSPSVPDTGRVVLGAGVLVEDGRLHAFGWTPEKRIMLARWPVETLGAGALPPPEWWCGARGWLLDRSAAVPVIVRGSTEFTIHRDARTGLLCQTQVAGFLGAALTVRWAERPEGPWSAASPVYVPPELARGDGTFVYAGKAHPQLAGADLVMTYASNASVELTLLDESIYYPRFVRVTMR